MQGVCICKQQVLPFGLLGKLPAGMWFAYPPARKNFPCNQPDSGVLLGNIFHLQRGCIPRLVIENQYFNMGIVLFSQRMDTSPNMAFFIPGRHEYWCQEPLFVQFWRKRKPFYVFEINIAKYKVDQKDQEYCTYCRLIDKKPCS